MMSSYKSLILSAVLATPVFAFPVQITMSGAIEFSNMTAFAVGQNASVSITYESSSPYQSLMNQQAFFVNAMTSVSFTSGGYTGTDNTDPFGVINKYNDLQPWFSPVPWDGISFALFRQAGNYTFTSGANTVTMPSVFSNGVVQEFEGIRVNFEANHPTVWNDWSLPTTLDSSEFNVNRSMLFYFSGGSFQVGTASISVESVPQAPTPGNSVPDVGSTALLMSIGCGGLGWVSRSVGRRRSRAT